MRWRAMLVTGWAVTTIFTVGGRAQEAGTGPAALSVSSVTVTIEGTSKKDPFLASTKTVRVTNLQLGGPPAGDVLQQVLQSGGLASADIAIPVLTLTSPDEGVAGKIHEALEAAAYPDIRFRLRSVTSDAIEAAGFVALRAHGTLTIAGVDRDVTLILTAMRAGSWLLVDGRTDVRMTDFGITPPKGFLGLLKTDPVVRVRFYLVLTATQYP